MSLWPLQKTCTDFYGDPRDEEWEGRNLVVVKCPWVLRYEGKPVAGIRIHRKCAASLEQVLADIWARVGKSQAEIDRIGMSVYGGSFNFRPMRGVKSLSMHAYGCAIDFDPGRNGLGDKTPAMDERVIRAFEAAGWEWGGHWSRPDGMHFQAARTREQPERLPATRSAPMVASRIIGPDALDAPAKPARPAPQTIPEFELRGIQQRLRDLGYTEVGMVDGDWGTRTTGAISAFQSFQGLPVTGTYDAATRAALATAQPRPVSPERAATTVSDLRERGSSTIKAADQGRVLGWLLGAFGIGGGAKQVGLLDGAQQTVDQVTALRPVIDGAADLLKWVTSAWWIAALAAGFVIWRLFGSVIKRRLDDQISGRHM
ncbi:MAG TPA: M15 family metallopeptidase [Xanthobacteraceae bacterium]|jgi:peptidoglycan hydrolase-like protein with peptidoglycan-binding domain|nr:MAG: hypothetical protein B7Z41_04095 [Rhizobiales bacterium 12-66-7]HQS09488.1 M15 family metallopeptidase [Xanthobacteraceae bacterium]HQS45937.1 M15 family metallopeptidase [Xanthobacteraceae bacterium]